jgi:hypothetical protein
MAKKLFAVTNIKCNAGWFDAGAELDPQKFDPTDLKSLYDAGALRIEDVADAPATEETAATPETKIEADTTDDTEPPAVVSEEEASATE